MTVAIRHERGPFEREREREREREVHMRERDIITKLRVIIG